MARVTRKDFDGNIHVVATVNQTAAQSIADAVAPDAEKLMCSTHQEMMEAVRDGKADAVLAASLFHFKEIEIMELKKYLTENGESVRL